MMGQGRDFNALLGAQFLGVFNDNLFKQLVLLLAVDTLFPGKDMQGIAFAVFALPFVLFSGMAGDLSERHSKRGIILKMKLAEIGIMVLGIGALMTVGLPDLESLAWPALLMVLFVMGTQSAFFGPAKYGVIPEIVPPEGLVPANGAIAMTTFLGALFGIALAGPLLDWFGPATAAPKLWAPGVVSVGLAVVGTLIATRMGALKALRPDLKVSLNPFGRLFGTIKMLSGHKGLLHLVMLNSFFWFNSGAISQAINGMSRPEFLDMQHKTDVSYLTGTISVGIIVGSAIAPRLAKRFKLSTLVVLGAVMMVVAQMFMLAVGTLLTRQTGAYPYAMGLLAVCGIGGAIMIVPVQSYLQDAPPEGMRGQTFAVNNFMNFLFMVLSGAFYHVVVGGMGPVFAQAVGGGLLLAWLVFVRKSVAQIAIGVEA